LVFNSRNGTVADVDYPALTAGEERETQEAKGPMPTNLFFAALYSTARMRDVFGVKAVHNTLQGSRLSTADARARL
jgi:hypothetical protein